MKRTGEQPLYVRTPSEPVKRAPAKAPLAAKPPRRLRPVRLPDRVTLTPVVRHTGRVGRPRKATHLDN